MGKRLATMLAGAFAAALLCAGLMPATALAAAPNGQMIYLGDETVTSDGYWTTDDNGNVTAYSGDGTPADNYIHYDAADNTLTLHNAAVSEGVPSSTSSYVGGVGIGVVNDAGGAELTIQLEGSNTIEDVSMGIYVLADSDSIGEASLTIKGDGSLDISGNQYGICVQSNSSDAALTIQNADVTATATGNAIPAGVFLYADTDRAASLSVDGGSLTATVSAPGPTYDEGIRFYIGKISNDTGTPSLTVSGNAMVRANGGIVCNSINEIKISEDESGSTGGIVFDGGEGTVYGSVTLQEDLEVGEGESLTIGSGASLTIGSGARMTIGSGAILTILEGVSLINEGAVTGSGSIVNNGTIYNGNGATLPSGITGSGPITALPAYAFECPDEFDLQESSGGYYAAKGALSLTDDPVLGEDGRIFVYATYSAVTELQNEEDQAYSIPLDVYANDGSSTCYFQSFNEIRVISVFDGGQSAPYTLYAYADPMGMNNVPNGTYGGTITLFVGYAKDPTVQFGDTATVDLNTLKPYTVKVTLENTLGLSVANQPQAIEVIEGETASFSVTANGGTTKTYQWQVSADAGASWTDIDGATDATYTTPATTMDMDGNQYRCVVTSGQVKIESDSATLTVAHAHKPASDWSNDASSHWHECEGCAEQLDFAVHAPVVEGKQNATCTEDGYTGDTVCSVCGYAMAKGAAIPAAGHDFVDGVCSACGAEDPDYVASEKPKPSGEEKSAPAIPATGDVNTFFSAVPALVGATAVAVGTVLRRRR